MNITLIRNNVAKVNIDMNYFELIWKLYCESENRKLIGTCVDEDLIDSIFGSVTDFAHQVELHGDNFIYRNIRVEYNADEDIHYFYQLFN
jgi:hypothetical protein